MTEKTNYHYANFLKFLDRRDEVGYSKAISEFKREQADGILDFMTSAGSHQESITENDCAAVSKYIDEED
jgi:hypothetical protein